MKHIACFSDNRDFIDDLTLQISRYVAEFAICDDKTAPDIAIVDEDIKLYKKARVTYPNIPLIFLGSQKADFEENSLNIYLKKPFLLTRFFDILRSANNKLAASSEGHISFGAYKLRPLEKIIENTENGSITKLTEKEIDIIRYLYKYSEEYISKIDLQKNVWKYNDEVSTHTVETHIYRLRRKVEKNGAPQLILTDKGGYKINIES